MTSFDTDFRGLRALFINCTLKRSPEPSNTQGLVDISTGIMEKHGIDVEVIRAVDHDIATGVWPDMREHGWATDDWPAIFEKVLAADILVLAGPIWLGDNSSVMKMVHERLYRAHRLHDPAAGRRRLDRRSGAGTVVPGSRIGRPGERLHQPQHDVHDMEFDALGSHAACGRWRAGLRNIRSGWDAGCHYDFANPEYR
jgi:multimeric flavodoxin WrbA